MNGRKDSELTDDDFIISEELIAFHSIFFSRDKIFICFSLSVTEFNCPYKIAYFHHVDSYNHFIREY